MDNTLPATITLQQSVDLVDQLRNAMNQYRFRVASPSISYVFSFSETDVEVTGPNGELITEWEEFAENLVTISASTPVSHIRVLENGVQVTMARRWHLNNYQSHRRDRTAGSLVTSLNRSSLHGTFEEMDMQIYFCHPAQERNELLSLTNAQRIQFQLAYLAVNLKLSFIQVKSVARWLISRGNGLQPTTLALYVREALQQMPNDFGTILANNGNLTINWRLGQSLFIERQMQSLHFVVMIPTRPLDPSVIGGMVESVWFEADESIPSLYPFALLPRMSIRRYHTPVLLLFREAPIIEVLRRAVDVLNDALVTTFSFSGRLDFGLITRVFSYLEDFQSGRYTMFRPDGRRNRVSWDNIITARVLEAYSNQYTLSTGWTANQAAPMPQMQPQLHETPTGIPRTLIIYSRVSGKDQADFTGSLAQQTIWSITRCPLPLERIENIVILSECISSWTYPWRARPFVHDSLIHLNKGPYVLLTASPERLTRQSSDIPDILEHFERENVTWLTSDFHTDGLEQMEWTTVDRNNESDLQEELDERLETSDQQRFYSQCVLAMDSILNQLRLLMNANNLNSDKLQPLRWMQSIISHHVASKNIEEIIIVCRTSPGRSTSEVASESSLSRQLSFTMTFLEGLGLPVTHLTLHATSAFHNNTLNRILDATSGKRNVLLLASSMDRMTRNEAHVDQFLELQQSHNIWTMFLLTSYQAFQMPTTAQEVADFVNVDSIERNLDVYQQVATWFSSDQNAFRNAAGKKPWVMPTVLSLESPRVLESILQDVRHAGRFVTATKAPSYGRAQVPSEMIRQAAGRKGMTEETAVTWKTTLASITQTPLEKFDVRYSNSQSSSRCSCKEGRLGVDRHPLTCICSCVRAPSSALVSANGSVTRAVTPGDAPPSGQVPTSPDAVPEDRLPTTSLRRPHEAVDPGEGPSRPTQRARQQG
ncbi:unnamed protein product [Umbelopsis ramanniana]